MLHRNPNKVLSSSSRPLFAANEVRRGLDGAEKHVDVECGETDAGVNFRYLLGEGAFGAGGGESGWGVVD